MTIKKQPKAKAHTFNQPILNGKKSITLCMSCGDMQQKTVYGSVSLSRMKLWQDYISMFWGHHPYAFKSYKYADFFMLTLAVLAAYFPEYRNTSIYFAAVSAILFITKEYIPFDPLPFNVYNVVTSRNDQFTTATQLMMVTLVYIFFIGVIMTVSEQLGNFIFNNRNDYSSPPENVWSEKYIGWLTLCLFVLPVVYFIGLQVSSLYVQPQINKLHPAFASR